MADAPLWTPDPDRLAGLPVTEFRAEAARRAGRPLADHDALHAWSIEDPGAFWDLVWDFCGVIGEKGERRLVEGAGMREARFFPDARLNYAENLLQERGAGTALVFRGEDKVERRLSWDELRALVSRLQQAMRAAGIVAGDRVAAMLPNLPETIAVMLATASLGAIWSSCSPDFGERGVLDRFGQIDPKLFVAVRRLLVRRQDRSTVADKLAAIAAQLPSAAKVVIVPYLGRAEEVAAQVPRGTTLDAFLAGFAASAAHFRAAALRSPAPHPLLVRHDRRAEMHRARRRRHAAPAPEGAPAALLAAAPASSSSTSPPAAG